MSIFPSASGGEHRLTPVSASREFAELASAIDPDIPSDRAAELIANFRAAVLNDAAGRSECLQTYNRDELRGIRRVTTLLRRLVKGGAA